MTNAAIDIKVSSQQYLNILYQLSDGTPHVMFGFLSPADFTSTPTHQDPAQFWDVNLSNGVSVVRNIALGSPPIYPTVTASNTVVLGTADPGRLVIFNPATGLTNFVKNCSDRDYYKSVNGTDGQVYIGTYDDAGVESYNPADGSTKEWGKLDTALSVPAYCYWVGADSGYIYGAIRENSAPFNFYLGIIRKSDTNKTVLWKTGTSADVQVRRATNGTWYAYQLTNAVSRYWLLTNEVPVLTTTPTDLIPLHRTGNCNNDTETWATEDGWNIDAAFDVSSVSGSIPTATIGYKRTNEVNFTSVTETNNWLVWKGQIGILQPWTDGNLLWLVNAYGPLGYFVPFGTTYILGPYKGVSVYDVLQSSASQVYVSGYHLVTMRWNPQVAWNRVPLMADYASTNVNPYNAVGTGGKYHYYLAKGSDGKIFIGEHHERGSTGGELGWYDPATGSTGSERTAFLSYDVHDLKPAESASKMVYVSSAAKIFVWNVSGFTQATNFTVLAGATVDKVVEYESGKLIGVAGTNLVGFTTAGVQLWSNNIPATAWGGTSIIPTSRHRLTLGPDNYVWLCAGGSLRRINPNDGSNVSILTTTNNYNVVFRSGDAFLYGDRDVWKITNLLILDAGPIGDIRAATANVGTIQAAP